MYKRQLLAPTLAEATSPLSSSSTILTLRTGSSEEETFLRVWPDSIHSSLWEESSCGAELSSPAAKAGEALMVSPISTAKKPDAKGINLFSSAGIGFAIRIFTPLNQIFTRVRPILGATVTATINLFSL